MPDTDTTTPPANGKQRATPPPKGAEHPQLGIALDRATHAQLQVHAWVQGRTLGDVLTLALLDWLAAQGEPDREQLQRLVQVRDMGGRDSTVPQAVRDLLA